MPSILKDIAEKVNVSVSTVSRVLNDKGRVSNTIRTKILETAREMDYRPNEMAQSLKTKKTSIIGVIVPDITNIFYARLLKGIEELVRNRGYSVIFCNSDENLENEQMYYRLLKSKNVCGMIIATAGTNDIYDDANILDPIVFVDNMPTLSRDFDSVAIDNIRAANELTQHLINKGYRSIATITGPLDETTAVERLQGYKDCLRKNGYQYEESNVFVGDYRYRGGYRCMMRILKGESKPTAILAQNNLLAFGAMVAMRENNIKVPDDIAIACFDAVDETNLIYPQLTCIVQPIENIGATAVQMIIDKIENRRMKNIKNILDFQFSEGEST